MMRIPSFFPALLLGLVLAGCDANPQPTAGRKAEIEGTRFAVTRMGEPFDVDGCPMQAYRVTTSNAMPNFTVVKADCNGTRMRSTEQSCGKSCTQTTVQVTPGSAPGIAVDVRRDNRSELEALQTRVKQTRAELDELDARMRVLQGAQPGAKPEDRAPR